MRIVGAVDSLRAELLPDDVQRYIDAAQASSVLR
jgi:hypothetical protein